MQYQFEINTDQIDEAHKRIVAIQKRAKRKGFEMQVDVSFRTDTETREDPETGAAITLNSDVTEITLTAPARPAVQGWELVGCVEKHPGDAHLTHNIGDANVDLSGYRTGRLYCDHCQSHRPVRRTFVLRNEATGELMRAGASCLDDFVGDAGAKMFRELFKMVADKTTCWVRDEWDKIPQDEIGDHPVTMLTRIASVIRTFGWVSKMRSLETGETATVDLVKAIYLRKSDSDYALWKQVGKPTENDKAVALRTLAWAQAIPTDESSSYLHNVRTIARGHGIPPRHFGIASSMIAAYHRANQADEVGSTSTHFGEVGKRTQIDFRACSVRHLAGAYGTTTMVKGSTAKGEVIVWFASGSHDWHPGDQFTGKATVKKHAEYRGTLQTVIQRFKAG